MVVQHNLTAMNANRYLGINNNKLSKSLEKLSSGYKINRAGDDAAGLAVSEKMRSQIAGMTQAVKNAQAGISMVQTYEGALTETDSILQRMKVLADQMSNGSYDNEVDRNAANQEFRQLNDELNQIADTDYNGVVVLNGGVMADGKHMAAKTIKPADIGSTNAKPTTQDILYSEKGQYYKLGQNNAGDLNSIKVEGTKLDVTAADGKIVAGQKVSVMGYEGDTVASTTGLATTDGKTLTAGTLDVNVKLDIQTVNETIYDKADGVGTPIVATQKVTIDGVDYYAADGVVAGGDWYTKNGDAKTTLLQAISNKEGVAAASWTGGDGAGTTGVKLTIDLTKFEPEKEITVSKSDSMENGRRNLTYADSITLQVGARSKDAVNFTFQYTSEGIGDLKSDLDCSARGLGTDQLTIATQEDANYAIDQIDNAINKVSMVRGTFGAIQNRLEHKIDNLNVSVENLTDAESKIRDTNMAEEMMNFTKQQILAQASQSMLAQANQLPQSVLSLLQ